jgi:uncharacterized membrane protein
LTFFLKRIISNREKCRQIDVLVSIVHPFLKGGRAMRSRWLVVVPVLLALAIGVPACKKSEEAPKPAMEQQVEKAAPAPMMEEAKEAADEAAAPVVQEAPQAAGEAQEAVGAAAGEVKEAAGEAVEPAKEKGAELMDTMKEKAAEEAAPETE